MASCRIFGARCSPQALYVAAIKSPKVIFLAMIWQEELFVLFGVFIMDGRVRRPGTKENASVPGPKASGHVLDIDPNADAAPIIPIAPMVMVILEAMVVMLAIPIAIPVIVTVMSAPIVGERLAGACQHKSYGKSRCSQEFSIIVF